MWNFQKWENIWEQRAGQEILRPIYEFLKKPDKLRRLREVIEVFQPLQSIEFFQQLLQEKPFKQVQQLVSKLTYRKCEKDEYVFKVGDSAKTFFIILEGEVRILAPYNDQDEKELLYDQSMLTHEVARRKAGQSFGELALLYNSPRSASVQAVRITHLAVLTKADYDEIIKNLDVKDLKQRVETLKICPMFSHWTKMSLSKLAYQFKTVNYVRKQVVFQEGDHASNVYIVVNGDFTIMKTLEEKTKLGEVAILGPGEIIGEDDDGRYTKSCICHTQEGQMLKITRKNFYVNIQNKESWKWHSKKTAEQRAWRSERMQKIEEREKYKHKAAKKKKITIQRFQDESPYFRKGDYPYRILQADFHPDQEIDKYLKKIKLNGKQKAKGRQTAIKRPREVRSPESTCDLSYLGSQSLPISPSMSVSPSVSPELESFRSRSFLPPCSELSYHISANIDQRMRKKAKPLKKSLLNKFEVAVREFSPQETSHQREDCIDKIQIPISFIPFFRRSLKPRKATRSGQSSPLKRLLVPPTRDTKNKPSL